MKRKLVITKIAEQVVTAVLENEEVVEIHVSDKDTEAYRVGNIYVGKVKNIVPNIQAAFIEIANGVECYYSIPVSYTHLDVYKRQLYCYPECDTQMTEDNAA